MDLGLQDKVAVVTGGSDGIGKAAALSMAKEGANVVIVARRQEVLDQAAEEIRAATEGVVVPLSADVMEPESANRIVQTAIDRFGRLDILVNNAGTSMAKGFEQVSHEDWEFDFELKVWGAVRLIQESIPEMRKVGGRPHHQRHQPGRPGPPEPTRCLPPSRGPLVSPLPRGSPRTWLRTTFWCPRSASGLIKSGQHQTRYDARIQTEPDLSIDTFYSQLAPKPRRALGPGR